MPQLMDLVKQIVSSPAYSDLGYLAAFDCAVAVPASREVVEHAAGAKEQLSS